MAAVTGRRCFLQDMPGASPRCDGKLRKCHLIPKQLLKREGKPQWDDRVWVWGCGGPMGNAGHHGQLDQARTLRIPRAALPPGVEDFAAEHGLTWWLEREYGQLEGSR